MDARVCQMMMGYLHTVGGDLQARILSCV